MLMPVKEGWTLSREAGGILGQEPRLPTAGEGRGGPKSWALQCPGPALPSGLTPSNPEAPHTFAVCLAEHCSKQLLQAFLALTPTCL